MDKGQKVKIAILDKSPFIKHTLEDKLADDKTEVRCMSSSAAALLTIIEWHPDVIITGVEVGEISGFDLCMILKLMPGSAAIPVIIISSGEIDALQRKAADVGADYYVPKDNHIIAGVREAIQKASRDTENACDDTKTDLSTTNSIPGSVLVVDDSSVMRRIIRNMLNSIGMDNIFEATDGSDALNVIKENQIGLVLTDWNMPVMNGLDLIKTIRDTPELEKLPVIMVTTEGGDKERKIASDAGASDHISKPFSREKIKDMVSRFAENIIVKS